MSLVLPDMNQALRKAGGRLFPLGLLKMLWHRRKIDAWRMPVLGVRQEHRLRGIEVVLCCRTYDVAKTKRNYRKGEMSWILESNTAANAVLKAGRAAVEDLPDLRDSRLGSELACGCW